MNQYTQFHKSRNNKRRCIQETGIMTNFTTGIPSHIFIQKEHLMINDKKVRK